MNFGLDELSQVVAVAKTAAQAVDGTVVFPFLSPVRFGRKIA